MKRIAIIPARGGSTRIPGKNIKDFHGKPIIAYSIETAIKSGLFDAVAVCTDSREIQSVGECYGASHLTRSAYHSRDEVGTQEVMRHAIKLAMAIKDTEWDRACCIYPASPMLTVEDLRHGNGWLDLDRVYAFGVAAEPFGAAGTFYFGRTERFLSSFPLVTPHSAMIPISQHRCIDINTMQDWERAETMYADWMAKGKPQ